MKIDKIDPGYILNGESASAPSNYKIAIKINEIIDVLSEIGVSISERSLPKDITPKKGRTE